MFGDRLAVVDAPVKVGVEVHRPYVERRKFHDFLMINADARDVTPFFPDESFDAVILVDFIEHLEMGDSVRLIRECQRLASKRVVAFVPHGLYPQEKDVFGLGGDYWQTHRSTWGVPELADLGFDVALWDNYHNVPGTDNKAMFAVWERPQCSIVIATFNKAEELDLCIRSIKQQSPGFAVEVIVVDDGSNDNTKQICRNHWVRYLYLDRPYHCNAARARNLGLRHAWSERVLLQEEVVHHSPNVIRTLVERMERGSFDFATVFRAIVHPNGLKSPETNPFVSLRPGSRDSGVEHPTPGFLLGAAFRSDLYAVGGFDESFVNLGGADEWLSDCLIHGRKLRPRVWDDVVGYRFPHRHPEWYVRSRDEMRKLYNSKRAREVFEATGGAWPPPGAEARAEVVRDTSRRRNS